LSSTISTLSLHDALPICGRGHREARGPRRRARAARGGARPRGERAARDARAPLQRDRARARHTLGAGADDRRRPPAQVRDDLLAPRRPRSGRGARRYLPGLPDARPTPALQPDPAQRRSDPLPELPAHALLARRGRGGQWLTREAERESAHAGRLPPEEVEQSLAAPGGGRKVRTPQGRVAANGGPERSGESATERRQPRAARRGAMVKR